MNAGRSFDIVKSGTNPATISLPMPKINVDGKEIDAKPGQMILQACLDAGMPLPHYCYHPGLSIPASCRISLCQTPHRARH